MTMQTLQYSSEMLAPLIKDGRDSALLLTEANRLKYQTDTLNSIIIAAADGEILAASPQTLDLVGKTIDSKEGKQALSEQRPFISNPYQSMTGRFIIFISHPIFDDEGTYMGIVGGSIYLMEDNVLYDLLGEHFYQDDSYVYVVDKEGRIIYHQDTERINDVVNENLVVQKLMNKESGAERIVNSREVDMLAGYAYVPETGWGIVAQRPTEIALKPNHAMIRQMIINSLPSLLLSIVLVFFIAKLIAMPLQKMALLTEDSTQQNPSNQLRKVNAWYYEAIRLKRALTSSLGFLHDKVDHITHESQTDALTQLTNRRTLDSLLRLWVGEQTRFALIVIDIDHFKRINDTYGHAVGDQVLVYLANTMKAAAGEHAVCCRYGGEEFVVLLPDKGLAEAWEIAERVRLAVCAEASLCGEKITISAGVAAFPEQADNTVDLFHLADQRLYEAKRNGRNRTATGLSEKLS